MSRVITVGAWTVKPGQIVSPDGVTEVTVISDGDNQLVTPARPADLVVALMAYAGIESIAAQGGTQ